MSLSLAAKRWRIYSDFLGLDAGHVFFLGESSERGRIQSSDQTCTHGFLASRPALQKFVLRSLDVLSAMEASWYSQWLRQTPRSNSWNLSHFAGPRQVFAICIKHRLLFLAQATPQNFGAYGMM